MYFIVIDWIDWIPYLDANSASSQTYIVSRHIQYSSIHPFTWRAADHAHDCDGHVDPGSVAQRVADEHEEGESVSRTPTGCMEGNYHAYPRLILCSEGRGRFIWIILRKGIY